MNLSKELAKEGINIRPASVGAHKCDCPKTYCQAARKSSKDYDGECLRVEIVSVDYCEWKCRSCLFSGHIGSKPPQIPMETPITEAKHPLPIPEVPNTPTPAVQSFMRERGIDPLAVGEYKISWDEEQKAIKIPYINNKEIINALYIYPTGVSKLASAQNIEFYRINSVNSAFTEIIICQREIDLIILEQAGFTNVISVPNGGVLPRRVTEYGDPKPDEYEYLSNSAEVFAKATRIILALDNTPEGEKLRYEIARRLGAGRCYNVNFCSQTVGQTLLKNSTDILCNDINGAKPYPISGLYEVGDFEQSLIKYFEQGMAAGVGTGWENVDKLYTVMPCEMTVVTGVPNNGKSSWLDALSVNLALQQNWKFAVFSPENGKEQHVTKLVEKRTEMTANPKHKTRMSLDTFGAGYSWVSQFYFFIVGDDESNLPTIDWFLDKAAAAILRYGVNGIILDPWNEIEHVRASSSTETEYISQSLSKLKRFARNHGIHLWIVAHPAKMHTDKDGNPVVPSLYDIAGSANWANKSDNGIVIHRSASIDDTTEVHVKKVRHSHVGKRGITKLSYDKLTGRFAPLENLKPLYEEAPDDGIKIYEAL